MKKVLFLSAQADIRGGGEFFLLDVIAGLSADFRFACVVPAEGDLAVELRTRGVPVFVCPTGWGKKLRSWLVNWVRVGRLAGELRSFFPDVIYANGGHTNNLAVRLARRLKCPVLVHIHDIFAPLKRDKFAFGRADRAVACSSGVAAMVRPFHAGVTVVYNGVDTDLYSSVGRSGAREKMGLSQIGFIVGFAGTIIAKKGISEFIDAARLIINEVSDAVFVVIGAPKSGEEAVLREAKLRVTGYGLESRFHWTGFVEDLHTVMPALDVLLFPAHNEAFGRVIIEAMACGVVPVSSFALGPSEIIEDGRTGFLRPYSDASALASAVGLLCRNEVLRARMAHDAREEVKSRFSRQAMLAGVEQAIKDAVKG